MNLFHWISITVAPYANSLFIFCFLCLLAGVDACLFPLPLTFLLITATAANSEFAFSLGLLMSLGSVLGGIIGYWIGNKKGRTILNSRFPEDKIACVENKFQKYGVWVIGLGGWSPIPYNLFTLSSGAFNLNFTKFILISSLSRGIRFLTISILVFHFSETILPYFTHFQELLLFLLCGFILSLLLVKLFSSTFSTSSEQGIHINSLTKKKPRWLPLLKLWER